MHDVAWPAPQNRMVAAVPGDRVADLSPFAQAGKVGGAEIPAKRALADVATYGPGVAQLGRGGFASRLGEKEQFFLTYLVFFYFREGGQGTDPKSASLFFDVIETRDGL